MNRRETSSWDPLVGLYSPSSWSFEYLAAAGLVGAVEVWETGMVSAGEVGRVDSGTVDWDRLWGVADARRKVRVPLVDRPSRRDLIRMTRLVPSPSKPLPRRRFTRQGTPWIWRATAFGESHVGLGRKRRKIVRRIVRWIPGAVRAPRRTAAMAVGDTMGRACVGKEDEAQGRQFGLTIQARGHPPCPSNRDPNPVQRPPTRNLMGDWMPWLGITVQKTRGVIAVGSVAGWESRYLGVVSDKIESLD